MNTNFYDRIHQTCKVIREKTRFFHSDTPTSSRPTTAIILGSGLSSIADNLYEPVHIPYVEIPGFPTTSVLGHSGQLSTGRITREGKPLLVFAGRFHTYEGYSAFETSYPVMTAKALGIDTLITTNAAGSLNTIFSPGDIMLIRDHINLIPDNPLKGISQIAIQPPDETRLIEFQIPFQDMTEAYDLNLRHQAIKVSIPLKEGILVAVGGPSYETPAEINMYSMIGGDAICMSTVPEVIMARYLKIKVLGLSLITNFAAGVGRKPLSHDDVVETGALNLQKVSTCLKELVG